MDTIPGDRPVATPLRAQQTTPYLEVPQLVVPVLSGSDLGQAASVCSPSVEEGDLGQVASEFSSSPGGGLGQVALDTSYLVASTLRLMAVLPSGEGSGQVALEPSSPTAPMCWGTLQKLKFFLRFHQDQSMSSSSNEREECIYIPL